MSNKSQVLEAAHEVEEIIDHYECLEMGQFVSAAGIPGNVKYNLDRIPKNSPEFKKINFHLSNLVKVEAPEVNILTAVPDGANSYGIAVAQNLNLPFLHLTKQQLESDNEGTKKSIQDMLENMNVGIIKDIRSFNHSTIRTAEYIGMHCVKASFSIINRGILKPGLYSVEEAKLWHEYSPNDPPYNVITNFPNYSVLHKPTPMFIKEEMISA